MAADRSSARWLAVGGAALSLILVVLSLAWQMPGASLVPYVLTSLVMIAAVEEAGLKKAGLFLMTAIALSLVFPGLPIVLPFVLFFGPYPLWRAFCKRRFAARLSWALRILWGLVAATAVFFLSGVKLPSEAVSPLELAMAGAGTLLAAAVFAVYERVLVVFIQFYRRRLRGRLFKN